MRYCFTVYTHQRIQGTSGRTLWTRCVNESNCLPDPQTTQTIRQRTVLLVSMFAAEPVTHVVNLAGRKRLGPSPLGGEVHLTRSCSPLPTSSPALCWRVSCCDFTTARLVSSDSPLSFLFSLSTLPADSWRHPETRAGNFLLKCGTHALNFLFPWWNIWVEWCERLMSGWCSTSRCLSDHEFITGQGPRPSWDQQVIINNMNKTFKCLVITRQMINSCKVGFLRDLCTLRGHLFPREDPLITWEVRRTKSAKMKQLNH